jgi:hypothetical protein
MAGVKDFTGAIYINHAFENIQSGTLTGTSLPYAYTSGTTKSLIYVADPGSTNFTFAVTNLPRTNNVSYTFTLIINTVGGTKKYYASAVTVEGTSIIPKTNGTISITATSYVIQQINVIYLGTTAVVVTSVINLS